MLYRPITPQAHKNPETAQEWKEYRGIYRRKPNDWKKLHQRRLLLSLFLLSCGLPNQLRHGLKIQPRDGVALCLFLLC